MTNEKILDVLRQTIKKNGEPEWIADNLLILHVGGSRLYETNRRDSDYDIRGVCFAPKKYYTGARTFETTTFKNEEHKLDFVIHDFRKWLKLVVYGNPNVIETLFVGKDSKCTIIMENWNYIKTEVEGLINRHVHDAFSGFSNAQIKKMIVKQSNKTGRQYITQEYGMDLKFLMHGFRIARQGKELLETGKITFPRPDVQNLLDVRYGEKYGMNDMQKAIDDWTIEKQAMDEAYPNSVLPESYSVNKYEDLLGWVFDNLVDLDRMYY